MARSLLSPAAILKIESVAFVEDVKRPSFQLWDCFEREGSILHFCFLPRVNALCTLYSLKIINFSPKLYHLEQI